MIQFTNVTLSKRSRSYILKICLRFETETPLLDFDTGCLYLTKWLYMVSRLPKTFQISDMTLKSKVKVAYTQSLSTARNENPILL